MRPRVEPINRADADERVEALYKLMDAMGNPPPNMHLTFGRNPDLYEKWLPFATYIIPASSLDARHRQILILRSAFNWRSGYVWAQHESISMRLGALTQDEIIALAEPQFDSWNEIEAALIRACDESRASGQVSDSSWEILSAAFSEKQLIDIVFTIGQYALIAIALKSLRVQLDDGLSLPDWA